MSNLNCAQRKYYEARRLWDNVFEELCESLSLGKTNWKMTKDNERSKDGNVVYKPVSVKNLWFKDRKVCFFQDTDENRKLINDAFAALNYYREIAMMARAEMDNGKLPKWLLHMEQPRIYTAGNKCSVIVNRSIIRQDDANTDFMRLIHSIDRIGEAMVWNPRIVNECRINTGGVRKNLMSGALIAIEPGKSVSFKYQVNGEAQLPPNEFVVKFDTADFEKKIHFHYNTKKQKKLVVDFLSLVDLSHAYNETNLDRFFQTFSDK